MKGKEEYEQVLKIAELGNLTPEEMNEYQQSLKIERDNYSVMKSAINSAKNEGVAEGIEIGEHNKAIRAAKEMLADNVPVNQITKYLKLSIGEIGALR